MWKFTVLTGVWTLAVAFAVWFGVQVWTDAGVMMYAGHSLSLILWGVPIIPLLLISWWLLWRWTGMRQRIPPFFFFGWLALILIPAPPLPMSHIVPGRGESTTTSSPIFWAMMGLISLAPVALTTAMWYSTIWARRFVGRAAP